MMITIIICFHNFSFFLFDFPSPPKLLITLFTNYTLQTQQSSWTRPDDDPYFLDESVQLTFSNREIKTLREIFEEEILHFEKVINLNSNSCDYLEIPYYYWSVCSLYV